MATDNAGLPPSQSRIDTGEVARRVRAARSYAQLTAGELAERIQLGAQTIKRIEAGRRNPRAHELWAIAEACGLPRAFFQVELGGLVDRAELVSDLLSGINDRRARLEQRLTGAGVATGPAAG